MSIKIYNNNTDKWETHSSKMATSSKVLDVENKFKDESDNVERCLSEIKDDINNIEKKVNYIYENGTIGGGSGGGGGSLLPTLTVSGDKEYNVTSDEIITISYSFTSNNKGNGNVMLTNGSVIEEKEVAQGRVYQWVVGPFPKSNDPYYLTINVCDSQGFWSGAEQIKVISGALELVSHFNQDDTFTANQEIEIPYEIQTALSTSVRVEKKFSINDPIVTTEEGGQVHKWKLKLPEFTGVYAATIKAFSGNLVSTLNFTIIVSDSENLVLSSSFPQAPEVIEVKYGQNLTIDYTNSMLGQAYFKTEFFIDDMETPFETKEQAPLGKDFFPVGVLNEIREYKLKIKTTTLDGRQSKELNFIVRVTSHNFEPWKDTQRDLIAHFEASGKMNTGANRANWENRVVGSPITCTLYNFNYSSNGWITTDKKSDLPTMGALNGIKAPENSNETVLRFSGKTYAVIDYAPFENGIGKGKGLTVEVVFRTKNSGDIKGKVISCRNEPSGNKGFDIDIEKALITTSYGEQVTMGFNEDEWVRIAFVIDRASSTMKIYCNGIMSGVTYIQDKFGKEDGFLYDGKIILGASFIREIIPEIPGVSEEKVIETFGNFSTSDIRTVRIYDRALSSKELLDNYIADVKIEEEQMFLREVNGLEEGFEQTIPIVNIITEADIENAGEYATNPCNIIYTDPKNPSKSRVFNNCSIKWQGTSSREYPVKNYTIWLKSEGKEYYGWTPDDNWKPESRWTLKANFMDSSQSNNVGASKFIHDFFKSNMYPMQTKKPGTRNNVDGFPMIFQIRGVFKGIYTFNIDRYSYNNYGFADYSENGNVTKERTIVSYEINVNNGTSFVENYNDEANLTRVWNDVVRHEFKHRYNGFSDIPTESITIGNTSEEVLSSPGNHGPLLRMLTWISSLTDDAEGRLKFRHELDKHFSIPHLIDYFLISYMLGAVDNLGKNMVLTMYGEETDGDGDPVEIWYPSFYDLDSIIGLNNVGANVVSAGAEMHNEYVTKNSRLWKWFIEDSVFIEDIKTRYRELRTGLKDASDNWTRVPVFSLENLMMYFGGKVSDTIGHKFYNEDVEIKYLIEASKKDIYMAKGSRRSFTEKWFRERLTFLDSLFGFGDFETNLLTMRTNKAGNLEIKIKTYSPQKTQISFSDGTPPVIKTTNKNNETTFSCYVSNDKDNNIKIKGAGNLMSISGIEELDVSILKVGNAKKLTNINLAGNQIITELELGENEYLRELDLSGCTNLGKDNDNGEINDNKTLNLSKCENLRVLKCNNTSVEGVIFPSNGGVLETLDFSSTNISNFNMTGQEYLDFINLSDCRYLSELTVSRCDGLKRISVPGSGLTMVNISYCNKLEDVDISKTNMLNSLSIIGCDSLKKLNMSGVSNVRLSQLDLSTLINLEDLDISGSSTIRHIIFGKNSDGTNFNKLKKFNCKNSAITTIRYRLYDPIPNSLDLAGLPLENISFDACKNLVNIENIKLITSDGNNLFNECSNLESITGEITISGSMNKAFYNCKKLRSIPTGDTNGNRLNLSGVTNGSETFAGCKRFTMNLARTIMHKLSSNFTSQWRFFASCYEKVDNVEYGLLGEIPSDMFSTTTKLTTLSEFFNGCTGINGGIDPELLKPMGTSLTNCYFAFSGTQITGGPNNAQLSNDLFRYNTNLETTERMFNGCNKIVLAPPVGIFRYNTKLKNVYGMFNGCSLMQGDLSEYGTLFRNNSLLNSVGAFFSGCSNMYGEIPRNIFDCNKGQNNSITSVEYFFSGLSKLQGSIPAYISSSEKGLLDLMPNLSNVRYLFNGCSGLTGIIPEDILKYNNRITTVEGMFQGCSKIGSVEIANIPPNLFKGKTSLTLISNLFNGCSNLRGNIPEGFLDDCPDITSISNLFRGCSQLVGQIPYRVSRWEEVTDEETGIVDTVEIVEKYGLFDKLINLKTASGVFAGCHRLTSTIPETLLIAGTNLTDVSEFFYGCHELWGGIPEKLLDKCVNLQKVNSMFRDCVSLVEPYIDEEEQPYAIPEKLFDKCFNLMEAKHVFRMDSGGNPYSPKLTGAIPPNLFRGKTNLRTIEGLFHACALINGKIDGNLLKDCTLLTNAYEAFGETNITGMGTQLFMTCSKLDDVRYAFDRCTKLEGNVFDYKKLKVSKYTRCFGGCTKVSNYDELKAAGWAD